MINSISSNLNFKGNVVIGQLGEENKKGKTIVAKNIYALEKNSKNAHSGTIVVNALNDFAKELALSTDSSKNLDIRFFYNNGYTIGDKDVNDTLNITVRDYDSDEAIIVEKDLGGIASSGKPIVYGEELMNTITDLFGEIREKTFEQLGLDDKNIKENKRINEIFNMIV